MKKIIKLLVAICFIVIPIFIEVYYFCDGIDAELEYKREYNGLTAFLLVIPSGSLILSSCAYFFVKLKYFPVLNMLLGFFTLTIGELVVYFHYQFSYDTESVRKGIWMIAIISLWIFLKSCIFKKIYKWLK